MRSSASLRSLLNYIGLGILIAGMSAGEFIYWRSLRGGSESAGDESPYDSRVYVQDMQRYVGTFGMLLDEWSRSVAGLGEPRPLAITIVVVSFAAAGGCFFAASRMPRD